MQTNEQNTIKNNTPTFYRSGITEARAEIDPNFNENEGIIEGYPIVFNSRATIGNYFTEEVDAHALDDADLTDIIFLVNHDDDMLPLARHRRGKRSTMDINIEPKGLHITAHLDKKNNSRACELCSAVERGDISDMSFTFGVEIDGEEWTGLNTDMPHRRITKIKKIVEVAAVNRGAYKQTTINARSAAALDNAKSVLDIARSAAAALDNEKRAKSEQEALQLAKNKFIFIQTQRSKLK